VPTGTTYEGFEDFNGKWTGIGTAVGIALGIGMLAPRYTNHRAGRWLIYTLFAYLAYSALTAWLSITIDQQLVRWILPQ
jgi:hypothetical protein